MNTLFFDSRMDLDTLWTCGLVGQPQVPASAQYAIALTASYTTDKYNLITRPGQSSACVSASKALFDNEQSPYISYSASFDSSQVNTDCPTLNGTVAQCVFSAIISYSTQMVQTTVSVPGISKLNIVLNAGALVGGVQFFAWFLAMFAAPQEYWVLFRTGCGKIHLQEWRQKLTYTQSNIRKQKLYTKIYISKT